MKRFNPWITAGVFFEVAFIVIIVYVPVFNRFFTTAPIGKEIWLIMCIAPVVILGVEEIRKFLVRRGVTILSA